MRFEADACCIRTRTFLRSSENFWAFTEINVKIKPWESGEDVIEGEKSYVNQCQALGVKTINWLVR